LDIRKIVFDVEPDVEAEPGEGESSVENSNE
jgi:hypothetical protein